MKKKPFKVQLDARNEDWRAISRQKKKRPVRVSLDDDNEDWQVISRQKRKKEKGSRF